MVEWIKKSIGELFAISGGLSASRAQLSDNGYFYLHYGDIHGSTKTYIDTDEDKAVIPRLNVPLNKVSAGSLLQDGDVVFVDASEDDIGASRHIVVRNTDKVPFIAGLHTIVAKPLTDETEKSYREYCFLTADVIRQFKHYAVGTKVTGVSKTTIKKIFIQFPKSLLEQREIAAALSDADGYITAVERLIAKKRDIKRGAMQELLCPNDGWEEVGINSDFILKARIGWQGLTTAEYLDDGYSYLVTGTDFANGEVDWKHCHYVDKTRFDQDVHIQISNNDVLITKDGTIGKVALVKNLNRPATLNSGVFVIRPKHSNCDNVFIYYVFMSSMFRDFLDALTAGSTIVHLYQKDFEKFSFKIPQLLEQQHIAEILSAMDEEIGVLTIKLNKVKLIKKGMMEQLLTGKIRLEEESNA